MTTVHENHFEPGSGQDDSTTASAYEAFSRLLNDLIERPYDRRTVEQEIEQRFAQTRAVMVTDMCGFSRTTADGGVVSFLLMIQQMRMLSLPVIARRNGVLIEAKADNLLSLFDDTEGALSAAREVIAALNTANLVLADECELYASIGIGHGSILNVGDQLVAGHEVNLAAKLGEDVADRGEILLTPSALAQVNAPEIEREERAVVISGVETAFYAIRP
jgi:adenylate cyclase